jgi:hypothetical protein
MGLESYLQRVDALTGDIIDLALSLPVRSEAFGLACEIGNLLLRLRREQEAVCQLELPF